MRSPLPQVQIQRVLESSHRQDGRLSLCPGMGQVMCEAFFRGGQEIPSQRRSSSSRPRRLDFASSTERRGLLKTIGFSSAFLTTRPEFPLMACPICFG